MHCRVVKAGVFIIIIVNVWYFNSHQSLEQRMWIGQEAPLYSNMLFLWLNVLMYLLLVVSVDKYGKSKNLSSPQTAGFFWSNTQNSVSIRIVFSCTHRNFHKTLNPVPSCEHSFHLKFHIRTVFTTDHHSVLTDD